jgi:hypothetical protein
MIIWTIRSTARHRRYLRLYRPGSDHRRFLLRWVAKVHAHPFSSWMSASRCMRKFDLYDEARIHADAIDAQVLEGNSNG